MARTQVIANVSLLFSHGQSKLVDREDSAQPWRAGRGTDTRHHTEVNRLKKEVWQYWPHSLRLITREQLGFRNLFLVWPICTIQAPKDLS
jgi:hypothetical protein